MMKKQGLHSHISDLSKDLHCCCSGVWLCLRAQRKSPSHCPPASLLSDAQAPLTDGWGGDRPSCDPSHLKKHVVFYNRKEQAYKLKHCKEKSFFSLCMRLVFSFIPHTSVSLPEPKSRVFLYTHISRNRQRGGWFILSCWSSRERFALGGRRGTQRICFTGAL